MADSRSNYSLTTFNSSGELVQIKHALAAVQSGATSLGIRAVNGVVLATEKKLPSTLVGEERGAGWGGGEVSFLFFSVVVLFFSIDFNPPSNHPSPTPGCRSHRRNP